MASKRAGRTVTINVSVTKDDLAVLKARAKRLYEGNLSAVIAESAEQVREEERRNRFVSWLDEAVPPSTPAERRALLAQIFGVD
jgi:hypothetical protein